MAQSRTVKEIAEHLGADIVGDATVVLAGVAPIEEAQEGELTFVANPKYVGLIETCKASALISSPELKCDFEPRILSSNPYLAFTKAMALFTDARVRPRQGVAPTALVHERAYVAPSVAVQDHVCIQAEAQIGEDCVLEPGVVIGKGAILGDNCYLEANAIVAEGCRLGRNCIIHAGTNIGGSGSEPGVAKAAHVVLGDDIELGANVVVQGGDVERPTQLGPNCKVDNLVNIGQGCQIGPGCILVSQVTMGRDVTLGAGVTLAGQVTVMDNCNIGSGAMIGAKSLVDSDIPEGGRYWGIPARPHLEERRAQAMIHRIPKLERMLDRYEEEKL